MIVRPRPGFEPVLKIIDAVNPFLVILSITGLFLEYTPLKPWIIPANQVMDLIFVVDFLARLAIHRPWKYFVHGYGWVDFLASLPGFMLLLSYTPIFALFKFVRIGRFFKIIRVLRFLRIFGFLKRMKSESPWIQDRIMKIGISIVLVFVVGIFFLDSGIKTALEEGKIESWSKGWTAADRGLLLVRHGETVMQPDGTPASPDRWVALLNDELRWTVEVPLANGDRLLVSADDLTPRFDGLMLILLTTLVGLLFLVIFYLGAVFAADMRPVHLIIDSLEAGDDQLLQQEARSLDENLEVAPDENEMDSLLKVVARISGSGMSSGSALGSDFGLGLPGFAETQTASSESGFDEQFARLQARLEAVEDRLGESTKETVRETVQVLAPAIIKYMRKNSG